MPEETLPEPEVKKFDPTILIILAAAAIFAVRSPENAKGALIFIVTLSVLVFVHEWGHYQFALWAGMKVNRFALGFPPWIYTKRRNGIDYSIGALPIGGMVDIAGLGSEEEMVATVKPASGASESAPAETGSVSPAAAAPLYERRPDRPRGEKQFQDASLGWRFMALFAGPLMNFIYAILVFIILFSMVGTPRKAKSINVIDEVEAGMPAFHAGLQSGDKIIGVNGTKTSDIDVLVKTITAVDGRSRVLTVDRGGQIIEKTLKPVVEEVENVDKTGKLVGYKKASRVGIRFTTVFSDYEKMGPVDAVKFGGAYWMAGVRSILSMLGRTVTGRLTSGEVRQIGGPVKIGQTINTMAKKGWFEVVLGSAALSLNLGLLNLLPLPALDGGRIMFLGYELVARKPIDPSKESFVHVVGMVLLLTFMVLITARDIWPFLERGLRGLTG